MSDPQWFQMTILRNWCEIDLLDGKELAHGERVEIKFPDGSTEIFPLHVTQRSVWTNDMGSRVEFPIHQANIKTSLRGLLVHIRIPEGTEMRRMP
jgi:hypothetical protein